MNSTVIGLDIGGTKIFAARFSTQFKIIEETKFPTESHLGQEKVLENIVFAIEKVRDKNTKAVDRKSVV